ncbi:Glucose-1-phosphate adenylyltransferase [Paenibacillus pasadenensis]|uniref:Glucose-1-phosphate adenylyltransferase n=1 Tax=Paenibacillus pasadenensis TaxID=217090 RepID=A0A2N5N3E8_9BACL|nr:glucose-1-phosphate adenylyltransferase [Paenibacillus pasadenensis]PLT44865.1 Glucose-1-phosphate adenylyltransferase [Paenibacillus pasadenensis]
MIQSNACLAMLLAGGEGKRLAPLTNRLAKPAVHFGGRYRIIDFPLSNCVNSGINRIGVLSQYMKQSITQHIADGRAWDNARIDLLSSKDEKNGYVGTADAIYQHIDFIEKENPEHVLIVSGDHIYQMDYTEMLTFHRQRGAAATIAVKEVPWSEASRFGIMNTNERLQVTEFAEKPAEPKSNLASMGVYIFRWADLKQALVKDAESSRSSHDFGKDIIPQLLSEGSSVVAFPFQGYWKDVGTPDSLWEAHMDLLNGVIDLNRPEWPMYTPSLDLSPAVYVEGRGEVSNSIVQRGCRIQGSVEGSILFHSVQVGEGSTITDSIIMPGARIGRGVHVHRAIVGEGAYVADGSTIEGTGEKLTVLGAGEFRYSRSPLRRLRPAAAMEEIRTGS